MAAQDPANGSTSRRHPAVGLHIDLGASVASLPDRDDLPPLAALFQITFDIKAGYTISWKRTADGVDLDGVEFQSLPSGLHNLSEDLVYFVHGQYAGVSAFVNVPSAASERNALMISVGVLVPLSYGRLGRGWRHAENLKDLAWKFASSSDHSIFEEYYETHRIPADELLLLQDGFKSPVMGRRPSIRHHQRTHSISEAPLTSGGLSQITTSLSQHHPARSLSNFISLFGPLVFPLYRAALARKRILFFTYVPVEQPCNFVYDISILSNIPLSVAESLPSEATRLKPLFSVGVHDIPQLEAEQGGYVACTTDEILCLKPQFYDVLVRLPPQTSHSTTEKHWPTLTSASGDEIKATQRDLRRYRAFTRALARRYHRNQPSSDPDDSDSDESALNLEVTAEKLTWREIAYDAFMWWASAGETLADEEAEDGRLVLDTHFSYTPTVPYRDDPGDEENEPLLPPGGASSSGAEQVGMGRVRSRASSTLKRRSTVLSMGGGQGSEEMDIIAYFHRWTQRILNGLLADGYDDDDEDEEDGTEAGEEGEREGEGRRGREREREREGERKVGWVSASDVQGLGLDRYSDADRVFVEDVAMRWCGRAVEVERGGRINCCGIQCG